MGLFDFLKKKEKVNLNEDISDLVYDYDSFDITFKTGFTKPEYYKELTEIITNNSFNIDSISLYKDLNINSSRYDFLDFYDEWLEKMMEENYVVQLTSGIAIEEFVANVNKLLKKSNSNVILDENQIITKYKTEVVKYSFVGQNLTEDFSYDLLEGNIVANELRKYNYELMGLYVGIDNENFIVIKKDDIAKMEELSKKITEE